MAASIFPEGLGERIAQLEKQTSASAQELAAALCAPRWIGNWWDSQCFLEKPHAGLAAQIKELGLEFNRQGEGSQASYHWLHFLSPLAAYGRTSRIWDIASRMMKFDPGIQPGMIQQVLPKGFTSSFWYSIGGDRLQDLIAGKADEDEYRADILGLHALERYVQDRSLTLHELFDQAQDSMHCVAGQSYANSPYYQIALAHINPLYSHKLLSRLAQRFPVLRERGIIPVEPLYS